MLESMTGFGVGSAASDQRIVSVEARSVNHRYLDVRVHVASELNRLAAPMEAEVKRRLSRGRVDVGLSVVPASGTDAGLSVDVDRARAYLDAYRRLASALGLENDAGVTTIASAPGVLTAASVEADLEFDEVAPALAAALDTLLKMRAAEGAALAAELSSRLDSVERLVAEVTKRIPEANEERRVKLERRISELLDDQTVDPHRLAQEAAYLVDRADVTEEVERLASHCRQFREMMEGEEAVGRRLDFLIQEMNREANTIGSKCGNTEVAYQVVDLKSELERMREQAQNVE